MRLPSYIPLVMLVAGAVCRGRPPPAEGGGSLPVEWAGCAVVRKGPRCELGPERRLTIWLPSDAAGAKVETEAGPLAAAPREAVQGGWRLGVEVPAAATWLSVEEAGSGRPPRRFRLALGEAPQDPEIEDLLARGKRGEAPGAAARLEEIIAGGPAGRRGPAQAALGRLRIAKGEVEAAEPAMRAAMAAARAEGRISDETRDGAALIWALVELRQRFAEARALVAALPANDAEYPEGRAWRAFHEGLLAERTGDLRRALIAYRESEQTAGRLGRAALAEDAGSELARVLIRIGRAQEALASLDRPGGSPGAPSRRSADPCARASRLVNRAWAMVEAARGPGSDRAVRDSPGIDPVGQALEEARRLTLACPDPHRRLLATLNAAEYAIERGDRASARELVAAIEREPVPTGALGASFRTDVLGAWALLEGRASAALARFEQEVAIASGAGLSDYTFRGQVGAGRALLALGRRKESITRFRAAQVVLERAVQGIPLTEGRGEFLSVRSIAVRHLVDALEGGGARPEALRVARMARRAEVAFVARLDRLSRLPESDRRRWDDALERYARLRRAIEKEAEHDWKLPRSEVESARREREVRAAKAREALDEAYRLLLHSEPAASEPGTDRPPAGRLDLVFFPGPHDWIAFANGERALESRRFPGAWLASQGSAAEVLALFAVPLGKARRVRILAYGDADRIDWHAVTWRGGPLVASAEVEYGLDLGGDSEEDGPSALGRILVVSDPTGDLPAAGEEGRLVARAFDRRPVGRLEGREATRDAVLARLPEASLFHYAGHADGPATGGGSSALILAGRARAELGDLLAVPHMPALVVLSACGASGSGASSGRGEAAMMGLAQAFLAAGAGAVLAPTRAVGDEAARAFIAGFYGALLGSARGSPASAFRSAAIAVLPRGGSRDDSKPAEAGAPERAGSQSFRLVVQ